MVRRSLKEQLLNITTNQIGSG